MVFSTVKLQFEVVGYVFQKFSPIENRNRKIKEQFEPSDLRFKFQIRGVRFPKINRVYETSRVCQYFSIYLKYDDQYRCIDIFRTKVGKYQKVHYIEVSIDTRTHSNICNSFSGKRLRYIIRTKAWEEGTFS